MPTSKPRRPKTPLQSETFRDGKIYLFIRSDYKKPVWHCRLKFRNLPQETYSTGETDSYEARKFADNLYDTRLGQIQAGIDVKSKPVQAALEEYIAYIRATEPECQSRKSKLSTITRWLAFFGKMRIADVISYASHQIDFALLRQPLAGSQMTFGSCR